MHRVNSALIPSWPCYAAKARGRKYTADLARVIGTFLRRFNIYSLFLISVLSFIHQLIFSRMDDNAMDRIASWDNPALTIPAASRLPLNRQRSGGHVKQGSTPAGDPAEMQSLPDSPKKLTKYDVRWVSFYITLAVLTNSGWMAASGPQLFSLLVLCNNGHWNCLLTLYHYSLQGRLAVLALCCLFRPQHRPLLLRLHHFRPPLHPLS
jgi:hypothetical protein